MGADLDSCVACAGCSSLSRVDHALVSNGSTCSPCWASIYEIAFINNYASIYEGHLAITMHRYMDVI